MSMIGREGSKNSSKFRFIVSQRPFNAKGVDQPSLSSDLTSFGPGQRGIVNESSLRL